MEQRLTIEIHFVRIANESKESDPKYNNIDVVKISEHRNTGIKTMGKRW